MRCRWNAQPSYNKSYMAYREKVQNSGPCVVPSAPAQTLNGSVTICRLLAIFPEAVVEFEKVCTNPADHSKVKREPWTATVTYTFSKHVKSNELAVNEGSMAAMPAWLRAPTFGTVLDKFIADKRHKEIKAHRLGETVDILVPVGGELGIERLGWPTFRHSHRSMLDACGAPTGVQQKLMRHAPGSEQPGAHLDKEFLAQDLPKLTAEAETASEFIPETV